DVILLVEDLEVCFGARGTKVVPAVQGVSFQIKRGETVALVGESGSGKSVTAMTVMRLTEYDGARITGGRILMRLKDGGVADLTRLSEKRMEGLRGFEFSIVFQDPMSSLNPVFTVGDQIAEVITRHQGKSPREARDIALNVLKLVRVPDAALRLDQYPHQLSGGMRQRLQIARNLVTGPRLVFMDEPTGGLDVSVQARLLDLLRGLVTDLGLAAIVVTHDLAVARLLSQRMMVMKDGRVVESGLTDRVLDDPRAPYTQLLVSSILQV
ncbi:MAG: ABC transporter ATP-binding protein, partial [Mesorhizobium sp.]